MQKIIDAILNVISYDSSVDIPKESFHKIEVLDQDLNIAFIDGGNAELMASSDFSLHFIRVYCVVFNAERKLSKIKKEFYCLTSICDGKYVADLFNGQKFIFDIDDSDLKQGKERVDISLIGGCVRRLLEIELALEVDSDVVVLDGSLQAKFALERDFMNKLEGKILMGVSKTSTELISGISVIGVLHKSSKGLDYPWYCTVDGVSYAKFNKHSKYIFKVEFTENFLGSLIQNSKDYIFPGYPYGLFLADKYARVSNKEKDYLVTNLKVKFGKELVKLENCFTARNAHQVLDSVN
ncbi:MAG: hypothetical protein U9R08_01365 [Nanoarchaeota archaeon]|nr:hypothetical protein [Nanoarchaeota archaeon]